MDVAENPIAMLNYSLVGMEYHSAGIGYFCPVNDFTSNEGVWLIDKPLGWTSFDVVRKMRNILGIKKIGHAGTLDPLATGLLIVCSGSFTKQIGFYMGMEKEYTGTFFIGQTTPSFDLETEPEGTFETSHISDLWLNIKAKEIIGTQMQTPPVFSAIKMDGKRAYTLARKGTEVKMKPREITIYDFGITMYDLPYLSFKITCSKGTYIRSVANDFGKMIGSGAYLFSLRRTAIGAFRDEDALTIEDLTKGFLNVRESQSKIY
jgi:tRNA pseudouridine55 synthase